ncbi:4'-phosphopantetheinyl transferase family protein [Dactylosporangium salmoneum]|uniref:4'-phosphopantetheinyl transferase superfamily protein n=1 Tax=Dactylosporangium salmoneum TaxID=53361 RepID=A0ABP5TZL9_9ACTN
MTTVGLWLVDLREPCDERLLTGRDRARRDALRDPGDRRRFAAAHAALNRVVRERLGGIEPRWTIGPNGKPEVAGLQVNLSHAGEHALIAVTETRPVGVDLQDLGPAPAVEALARRFFPPGEAESVAAHGPAEFARLWARKEAVLKAAGDRLMRGLALPVAGDPPPAVVHDGAAYAVADVEAPDGYRAAIALAGPEPFTVRVDCHPNALTQRYRSAGS